MRLSLILSQLARFALGWKIKKNIKVYKSQKFYSITCKLGGAQDALVEAN